MKVSLTIFLITFLAEMGDKTQLSTLLFASNKELNPALTGYNTTIPNKQVSAGGGVVCSLFCLNGNHLSGGYCRF